MKGIKTLAIAVVLLISSTAIAQKGKIKRAGKEYDKYAFVDAQKVYLRLAENGVQNAEVFSKLGDTYYFNNDFSGALRWYEQLFALDGKDIDRNYYFRYALTLKSNGNYVQADKYMSQFYALSRLDKKGLPEIDNQYLQKIKFQNNRYEISPVSVNTDKSDYGANFYGPTQVVYASVADTGIVATRRHAWNNEPFSDLYIADRDSYGALSNSRKFDNTLNSILHESTPTFSQDRKTVYFTRNNYTNGKKGEDQYDVTRLKIYMSKNDGKKWSKAVPIPLSSDEYSTSHPALTPDGKYLYFSSNMPGTVQPIEGHDLLNTDIYRSEIGTDGSFGAAENLSINTLGRESFPFISANNQLYFSSNGHAGLGGLDIFVSDINPDGSLSSPINIGEPANSRDDDFAFVIDDNINAGYLSSNRSGGKGSDDIYKFEQKEFLRAFCEQSLSVTVKDFYTKEPLGNVNLIIKDLKEKELASGVSSINGNAAYPVDCETQYFVRASKNEYFTSEELVTVPATSGITDLEIFLTPEKQPVIIGDDLGKVLQLKPIFFDLDKSNIRKDAEEELLKVLAVLLDNPNISIDIRSHTDSRADAAYNIALSTRRANSTRNWLIKKGIKASRLTSKGYGETELVNDCKDGVSCSEAQHQQNRRSEFVIVSID